MHSKGLDSSIGFPKVLKKPVNEKAVNHMFKVISSTEGKVTIVATGCLTNVAILLNLYPEVTDKIEQIVLMGGCLVIQMNSLHLVSETSYQGTWKYLSCSRVQHSYCTEFLPVISSDLDRILSPQELFLNQVYK